MLMTTDTLQAATYIKEQYGQQDVTSLTHTELMSRVESIASLDTVLEAVTTNQEFDLYAVDRIFDVVEWVRTQMRIVDNMDFKKNAKLFSNFVNRLVDYRIKKYNELTSIDKFLNSYS